MAKHPIIVNKGESTAGLKHDITTSAGVLAAFTENGLRKMASEPGPGQLTASNTLRKMAGQPPVNAMPAVSVTPRAEAKPHFKTAAELQAAEASAADITKEANAIHGRLEYLSRQSEANGGATAEVKAEYDGLVKVLNGIEQLEEAMKVDYAQLPKGWVNGSTDRHREYVEGQPLAKDQSVRSTLRNELPGDVRNALESDGREDPDFGKYIRGAFTGEWDGAEAERILMVQSGGADASGGVKIPTILTADLIDMARNQTRVLQAGARVVPMRNRKVEIARWLSDPEPEWRAENDPIAEDDATLDKIELVAHSLAVVTRATRELVEDTDIGDDLKASFANSFALKLDWAALYGTGADDMPLGVKATPGVNKTPIAANGGPASWDDLVDAVGRLRDLNENPNAQILSDRTARGLAKLKDANEQYLNPPSYLDGVSRYSTNQVPNNLVVGTSGATTSDIFTGDWARLLCGVRTNLVITMLTERYMTTNPDDTGGQYGFVAWWRGDFAVTRPKAFDVVTGVKA